VHPRITRRHAVSLIAATPALFSQPASAKVRGIDETGFVSIGGIEQWVAIQGSDVRNPLVVFLHGGPAEAQSPFLKAFVPWQGEFTVVNWDQRGSGRTYGRNGAATPGMSTPDMALDRLCEDTREVAQYARKRLAKKKVILVGQSWGTELGLHVIKRWPDLFYAFVGTGQAVSWSLKIEAQERWARAQAIASGDQDTLKALDETASLPVSDPKRTGASRKYRMSPSDLEYLKMPNAFLGAPPFPKEGEVADWLGGSQFSFPKLAPIEYAFDARKLGLDIPVPYFVIQGKDDHIAPLEVARDYVADVRAPKKAFIPIDGGHWACFTNAPAFVEALRRSVKPLI
jgi:pimeloyl-ACP methyl ester carboxylesterase